MGDGVRHQRRMQRRGQYQNLDKSLGGMQAGDEKAEGQMFACGVEVPYTSGSAR